MRPPAHPGMVVIMAIRRCAAAGALLAVLVPAWAAGDATGPWLNLPQSRETFIQDPVFQGRAYVYEAGLNHPATVVLVHGIGDQGLADWAELIPELARSYHVLTFALPGFGRSEKGNRLYSPANYVAFIKAVVERFAPEPFFLIGHSMGGAIVLKYAATYPGDVRRLVVVDAAGILHKAAYSRFLTHFGIDMIPALPEDQRHRLRNLAGKVLEKLEPLSFAGEMVLGTAFGRERFLGADPAKISAYALVEEDFSRVLPQIEVPTLVIWGEDDQVAPLRTGELLQATLAKVRLEVLPGVGHVPMTAAPARFNRLVLAFLTGDEPIPEAPLRWPPPASERVGRCQDERGRLFEGDYDRVIIDGCKDVVLRGVRAHQLMIRDAWVQMDQVLVDAEGAGLIAEGARITATGGRISGDVALRVSGSHLDLAGVELHGRRAVADAPPTELPVGAESTLVFSVCRVQGPHAGGYMHGLRKVSPDSPL